MTRFAAAATAPFALAAGVLASPADIEGRPSPEKSGRALLADPPSLRNHGQHAVGTTTP